MLLIRFGLPFVVCQVLLRPCVCIVRDRLSTCQAFCPMSFAYKTRHFAQLEHLFGFCRLKMQRAHRCGCARAMSRRPIEDALSIAPTSPARTPARPACSPRCFAGTPAPRCTSFGQSVCAAGAAPS